METSGGKDYGSSQADSEQSTDETTTNGDVMTTQLSSFLHSLIHMPANKKQQLVSTSAAIVRNTNTNTNSNLDENGEKGEIVPQSNENSLNSSPKEATNNEVTINREKAFEVVYGSIKVDRNGAKPNEKCFVVDAFERCVRIVNKSDQKKQPNKLILLEDIPENELIRFGQIFPDDNEGIDHFVHCEFCNKYYDFSCLEHPLYQCLDRETLNVPNSPSKEGEDRAALTLPGFLYIRNSQIPNAGKGVFTKVDIPIGIVFGPYEGILLKDAAKANQDGYAWELRTGNGKSFYIDAKDPRYSNWMRYINSPRHEGEQNLIAFQYRGSIFYRVYRPIDKDSELLVWKKIRERIGHNKLHRN